MEVMLIYLDFCSDPRWPAGDLLLGSEIATSEAMCLVMAHISAYSGCLCRHLLVT